VPGGARREAGSRRGVGPGRGCESILSAAAGPLNQMVRDRTGERCLAPLQTARRTEN